MENYNDLEREARNEAARVAEVMGWTLERAYVETLQSLIEWELGQKKAA